MISLERKSICLHTCYQVTYSLFQFLLFSFLAQRCNSKFKFRKEKHSIDNFQNVLSSEGVLRQDKGEPRGTKKYAKDCKKGQRILRRKKKFLMVKAIMVFFSLLFPYSRRGNVSSSKSTLIVIFFLVMSQLLHTFFPL